MELYKCKCDDNSYIKFMYENISIGIRTYKCKRCNTRCRIPVVGFIPPLPLPPVSKKSTVLTAVPTVPTVHEILQDKILTFKVNPLLSIFQEIEQLSQTTYDPNKMTLNEYLNSLIN